MTKTPQASTEIPEPKDIDSARLVISTLADQLKKTQRENEQLKQRIDQLCRRLFGRKSEQVDPRQLSLALAGLGLPSAPEPTPEPVPSPEATPRKRRSTGRRPLPKDLARERVVIDVPDAEKVCDCGATKVRIGSEVSEKLEYIPSSFLVRETERLKYACGKCHEGVTVAPAPPQAVEKGMAGEGLLAHVTVSKYADHLPLNRLERIYARQGVELPRNTLCEFVGGVARALEPIGEELRRQVLASGYIQTDDTPVTVLEDGGGRFTGRLWVYLDPIGKQVAFEATRTRGRDGPEAYLESFKGYLQADAYSGYDAVCSRPDVVEVGCWAHARRYYVEALSSDSRAAIFVALIKKLYELEHEIKGAGIESRQATRRERAALILERFDEERQEHQKVVLPKSPLGEALRYSENQWDALTRYVEDGHLDIDNNGAERQLRAVAVGRKNWMFLGNLEGAHRAALLYSLIQSCRLVDVDPWVYLRDVLIRVATHPQSRISELVPKAWLATFAKSEAA